MISKLPKWVEYGAFVLAFVAGTVNAIGLMGFEHQSVSHLSGTATLLGTGLIAAPISGVLHLSAVLVSFLVGAAISGFMLNGHSLRLGRHYEALLVIESAFLLGAMVLLEDAVFYGHYLASAACGLQNALATTYSGAVVRTTHVTGIFTDLGLMLGEAIKGRKLDRRKAILFLLIIAGFISGGTSGALLFQAYHFHALAVPAVICLLLAIGYRVYSFRQRSR